MRHNPVKRGLRAGTDSGKLACSAWVVADKVYTPEATDEAKQILRFFLRELYALPETARYRVRMDGEISWQKDAHIAVKTKGHTVFFWKADHGKPYKWSAVLGSGKWGWIAKLRQRRAARKRQAASNRMPADT